MMSQHLLICFSANRRYNILRHILAVKSHNCVFRHNFAFYFEYIKRNFSNSNTLGNRNRLVLGIETSCDDTGVAVVDERGNVLGDAINSQTKTHVELGGIIPTIARDLHSINVSKMTDQALLKAGISLQDLEAIAVTVEPGLKMSLSVGLRFAKKLVNRSGLPLIPIHHMEAHALTARMIQTIDFPFLVLLISGGHCLLAIVQDISDFLLLGSGLDDSPGDAFDKTARELKLKLLPQCSGLSGGAAIELMARRGDHYAFIFSQVMTRLRDCNFSFAGMKSYAKKLIKLEVDRLNTPETEVVSTAPDICASFQYAVLHHLCRRLQRAFLFCELKSLLPAKKILVVSGGVACNGFLRSGLQQICDMHSCQLICPPSHLCTDNGVMIAWNGVEKMLRGIGVAEDVDVVDIRYKSPLGRDISEELIAANLKLPKLKLSF